MPGIDWANQTAASIMSSKERDAVVIVPIASTEQHGPHLPVRVDSLLVGEIARLTATKVVEREPILVTPVLWLGLAEHHMPYGGTMTLDFATFLAVIRCICRSITRHGFRRILLLNGHGGNIAALNVVVGELTIELGCPLATATYWIVAAEEFGQILEKQPNVCHACEAETSMVMAIRPELVDLEAWKNVEAPPEELESQTIYRWHSFKDWTRSGVIGVPAAATPKKGTQLLEAAATRLSKAILNGEIWNYQSRNPTLVT